MRLAFQTNDVTETPLSAAITISFWIWQEGEPMRP